jgi:hypothetical protein
MTIDKAMSSSLLVTAGPARRRHGERNDRAGIILLRLANRDARASLGVLVRLDVLQLRAIVRGLLREPVAVAGIAGIAAAFVATSWRFSLAARSAPASAPIFVAVGAALAFGFVHAGLRGGPAESVARGPFGPLLLPGVSAAWLALRAVACLVPFVLLASLGALVAGPRTALTLAASALGGLAVAAVAHLGVRRSPRPQSRDHRRVRASQSIGVRGGRADPLLIVTWAYLRRRMGRVPVYLLVAGCFALASAAAAIARTNSNADTASAVVLGLSVPALQMLARVDARLIQLLGHEPISLTRLLGRLLGFVGIGVTGLALAALAASIGLDRAAALALVGGLGLALYLTHGVLHALVRRHTVAAAAASLDFGASVALPLITPWAAIWPLVRLPMLVRAARRRRWLQK